MFRDIRKNTNLLHIGGDNDFMYTVVKCHWSDAEVGLKPKRVLVVNRWVDSLQLLQKDGGLETIGSASGIEEEGFRGGRHRVLNVWW